LEVEDITSQEKKERPKNDEEDHVINYEPTPSYTAFQPRPFVEEARTVHNDAAAADNNYPHMMKLRCLLPPLPGITAELQKLTGSYCSYGTCVTTSGASAAPQ
jgi:hypothetical protein